MAVLVVALIALVVVLILRAGKARIGPGESASERGIEILSERFARGEIDAATFRSMKAELREKA